MRLMGLEAVGPKPNLSKPQPSHTIYPYLLKGIVIEHPNQVWSTDMDLRQNMHLGPRIYSCGTDFCIFVPLLMDLPIWTFHMMESQVRASEVRVSRFILSWRLSNTLLADFCVEALQDFLTKWGKPEIFNTDQGSQADPMSSRTRDQALV